MSTAGKTEVRATARATALRILAFKSQQYGTSDEAAAQVERAMAHVFRALSVWVGSAGTHALFGRALVLAATEHPVLAGVRHRERTSPHLDRLAENARERGAEATVEAATAVLASVIATLSGLIGEDIALSLLDGVSAAGTGTREASDEAATTAAPLSNHGKGAS